MGAARLFYHIDKLLHHGMCRHKLIFVNIEVSWNIGVIISKRGLRKIHHLLVFITYSTTKKFPKPSWGRCESGGLVNYSIYLTNSRSIWLSTKHAI